MSKHSDILSRSLTRWIIYKCIPRRDEAVFAIALVGSCIKLQPLILISIVNGY